MGQWIRGRLGLGHSSNTSGSGSSGGGTIAPQLAGIRVTPNTINSSTIGSGFNITATPIDQFGNPFSSNVVFNVLDPTVAHINQDGSGTVVGVGSTIITATAGAFVAQVNISVTVYVPVYHLEWIIAPNSNFDSLQVTQTISAQSVSDLGVVQSPQPVINISSTNPNVVGVTGNTIKSATNGISTIIASSTGIPNLSKSVNVQQVAASIVNLPASLSITDTQTGQLLPIVHDANGQVFNTLVSFASEDSTIVSIDSNGNYTGKAAGLKNLIVTAGGIVVNIPTTVTHVAVATPVLNTVTPTPLNPGQTGVSLVLTGTGIDANVTPVFSDLTGLTWSSITRTSTTLTLNSFAVAANATVGNRTVKLHSSTSGDSGTQSFTIAASGAPIFTSITPNSIAQNSSGTLAIVGDRLTTADILALLPTGLTATNIVVTDSQHISFQYVASSTLALGSYNIKITDTQTTLSSSTLALSVVAGGAIGTARSNFYFLEDSPVAGLAPSGQKSIALPLARAYNRNGGVTWHKLTNTFNTSGANPWTQCLGGNNPQSAYWGGFVTDKLSAQNLPSGNYTIALCGYQESGTASFQFAPSVYVYRPSTGAVVAYLHDSATGIGNIFPSGSSTGSDRLITFNVASPISIQDGDVICVEVYAVGANSAIVHIGYNGNLDITADGSSNGTNSKGRFTPPSPIYTAPSPVGIISIGPSGYSSTVSNTAITPVTVTTDPQFRAMIPTSTNPNPLWDSTATNKLGTAGSGGVITAASAKFLDLIAYDTTNTYVDRDGVTKNSLLVTIKPSGGSPVDPSHDANNSSSATPELDYQLPGGRAWGSLYCRRIVKFKNGFRLDCPNNTVSNTSGFNYTQSGAYKWGPHPENNYTRADFEITGGQNFGSEYLTSNIGVNNVTRDDGVRDDNYIIGSASSKIPNWNTAQEWWEVIRVIKVMPDNTLHEKVWFGKLSDPLLTLAAHRWWTIDTGNSWAQFTGINLLGKNFNRQLASTDAFPQVWFGDTQFADITDSSFTWPSQIPAADQF